MATVPAITDGNTWAAKTASVSTPPGEENVRGRAVDWNAARDRLAEQADAINTNDALRAAAQADATQALADAAAAQADADAAQVDATQALADAAAAQADATAALTPTLIQEAVSRALSNADLGAFIESDSSGAARTYTLPTGLTIPPGRVESITIVRKGANDVVINPSGVTMEGLPVSGGSVTIGVDGGVVTIVMKSSTTAFVMGAIS